MANVPPTNAEIDAWVDANYIAYITNVLPYNIQWGTTAMSLWVVAYTQNNGTKVFWTTNQDPTTTASLKTVLDGYASTYSVNIRAYSGGAIATLPSQPTAASCAMPDTQQAIYNDQTKWATAP